MSPGRALATPALLLLLAGCGRTVVAAAPAAGAPPIPAGPAQALSLPDDDATILHVLDRVTFGPRPGDLARVRALGLGRWLEAQLAPDALEDGALEARLAALPTLVRSIGELHRDCPRPDPALAAAVARGELDRRELAARYPPERRPRRIATELAAARLLRAVASERQLQEVMVDFWFNHFNVFAGKGEVRWYVGAYEREAIRPHALGRFPDLLRATARHPAMLFYLDAWRSVRPDRPARSGRGRTAGLNENYARELMELHTLGVDGGYTQADVREVARAFTGWTIADPRGEARFVFRAARHDPGEKVVLGRRLPAGGGQADGERVLDLLAAHPATARFVAGKLVRRFVADDPPPALVERVAATYRATGGDIRAMLRTILAAPEFLAARGAKVKKPVEYVASAVRALGAEVEPAGGLALARAAAELGEPLYGASPPTGWPDRAEAWVSAGALLARLDFALALAAGRLEGVRVDLDRLVAGADRARPAEVLDHLLAALRGGRATAATRAALAEHLASRETAGATGEDRGPARTDVGRLAALVLGAPEFQRR